MPDVHAVDRVPGAIVAPSGATASPAVPGPAPSESTRPWPWPFRLAVRFGCAYMLLYTFPFPIGALPFTERFAEWLARPWHVLVPWVGAHVLGLDAPIADPSPQSGDTTWHWVRLAIVTALAIAIAAAWTLHDRRRRTARDDWRLLALLRWHVRYWLGVAMLTYGAYKVIKSQFPFPTLDRLAQTVGDLSPMGLMWTFMGYSTWYNVFTGMGEMLAGALLFVPRTATIGALLSAALTSNIVLLNFTYDLPVKIHSAHLLFTGFFLAAPDLRRLAILLVLRRPVEPPPVASLVRSPRWRRTGRVVSLLFLAWAAYAPLRDAWTQRRRTGDAAPASPLEGYYDVERFVRVAGPAAGAAPPEPPWRTLVASRAGVFVRREDDEMRRYQSVRDTTNRLLVLLPTRDGELLMRLTWTVPDRSRLVLRGPIGGVEHEVVLRRRDPRDFLLLRRGFHWVSESPFNR
jgi:hypothetical protein